MTEAEVLPPGEPRSSLATLESCLSGRSPAVVPQALFPGRLPVPRQPGVRGSGPPWRAPGPCSALPPRGSYFPRPRRTATATGKGHPGLAACIPPQPQPPGCYRPPTQTHRAAPSSPGSHRFPRSRQIQTHPRAAQDAPARPPAAVTSRRSHENWRAPGHAPNVIPATRLRPLAPPSPLPVSPAKPRLLGEPPSPPAALPRAPKPGRGLPPRPPSAGERSAGGAEGETRDRASGEEGGERRLEGGGGQGGGGRRRRGEKPKRRGREGESGAWFRPREAEEGGMAKHPRGSGSRSGGRNNSCFVQSHPSFLTA